MTETPSPARKTYVRRSHQLWLAIPDTFFAFLTALVVLGDIGQAIRNPIPVVLWVGLTFSSYRVWRLALMLDDSGITVRNWLSSRKIPWDQVQEARVEPDLFWQRNPGVEFVRPGIEIVLHDGSSVVSVAFDREWGEEPDKRLHVVDEVNAAVQAHRAGRG